MQKEVDRRSFIKRAGKTAATAAAVVATGGVSIQSTQAQTEKMGVGVSIPFKQPPTVYIQDLMKGSAYLVDSTKIEQFSATPQNWSEVGGGTVTFVIPDGSFTHPIPPFYQDPSSLPSVLIQHPALAKSYYITYQRLQEFIVGEGVKEMCRNQKECGGADVYDFSFILPIGMELIQELPAPIRAMIQTQESMLRRVDR